MTDEALVSRMVLSDQVKDHLLRAILDGRYQPGSRIVETRVARELGTSQAPVREALRDLEALGLIETSAFRGARVRLPTVDELLEALTVRAQLESLAARQAVGTLADSDLTDLGRLLGEMRRAARTNDAYAEAVADSRFHARIVELSGNATLGRLWGLLEPFSRTYITMVAPGADRFEVADLHQPLLDALRQRDATGAVAALDHHYTSAGAMLTNVWAATTPASEPPLE